MPRHSKIPNVSENNIKILYLKLTTHAIIDSQQFFAKGSILDAMFDGLFVYDGTLSTNGSWMS